MFSRFAGPSIEVALENDMKRWLLVCKKLVHEINFNSSSAGLLIATVPMWTLHPYHSKGCKSME